MKGTVRIARSGAHGDGDVVRAIRAAGYSVRDASADGAPRQIGRLVAAGLSGILLGAGMLLEWMGGPLPPVPFLAASVFAGAWYVVPKGLRGLRAGSLDINFLRTLAAIGAAIIGQWSEAAAAMFLFAVAQLLEGWAMGRARRAIGALMQLAPQQATVHRDGRDVVVPVGKHRSGRNRGRAPGRTDPSRRRRPVR